MNPSGLKLLSIVSLLLLPTPHLSAQNPIQTTEHQVRKVHNEVSSANPRVPFHADWPSLSHYRTPDWFRDAKFGIFLHWGVYSVPAFGNEWYSRNMYVPGDPAYQHHITTYGPQDKFGYKDFIPLFTAPNFDPTAWVDLFAKAGARYIVPVGEHCDGFAMYNSDITPWNAVRMGPHRDIVGELAAATRARGLRFGVSSHTAEHWWWYGLGRTFPSDVRNMTPETASLYGPAEPRNLPGPNNTTDDTKEPNPDHLEQWLAPNQSFMDNWLARTTEIVDKYHPDFMYLDWWISQPAFQSSLQQFAAYFYDRSSEHNQQPVLAYKVESMPANAGTLDIERGKLDNLRLLPWQTDTSISIHSWGYVEHDQYRTAKSLIHQLVDAVSKNGNLLLNVGPKADGTIPEEARAVLLQIGEWLHINGEAIYNSRPFLVYGEGPTIAPRNSTEMNHDIEEFTPRDIRYTTSKTGATLYATTLGWPTGGGLILHTLYSNNPYLPHPICKVSLMGTQQNIPFHQQPDGLHLTLPANSPASLPKDLAYVFVIPTTCTK